MNKTEKIEKTLNSLDGINRAQANPFLFEKIKNRMNGDNKAKASNTKLVFATVIALAAAVILNIFVWQSYSASNNNYTTTQNSKQDISSFAKEYFGTNSTYYY